MKLKFFSPLLIAFVLIGVLSSNTQIDTAAKREKTPLNITDIKQLKDGNLIVTEKNSKRATIYSPDFTSIRKEIVFDQIPTGIAVSDDKVYVTLFETKGEVAVIDPTTGNV